MLERLLLVEQRYDELNQMLMDPAVISDNARYRDLIRLYTTHAPRAETIR